MTRPVRFTKADLKRACEGVKEAGLPVARIVFANDSFEVIVGDPESQGPANPLDRLLNGKKA